MRFGLFFYHSRQAVTFIHQSCFSLGLRTTGTCTTAALTLVPSSFWVGNLVAAAAPALRIRCTLFYSPQVGHDSCGPDISSFASAPDTTRAATLFSHSSNTNGSCIQVRRGRNPQNERLVCLRRPSIPAYPAVAREEDNTNVSTPMTDMVRSCQPGLCSFCGRLDWDRIFNSNIGDLEGSWPGAPILTLPQITRSCPVFRFFVDLSNFSYSLEQVLPRSRNPEAAYREVYGLSVARCGSKALS